MKNPPSFFDEFTLKGKWWLPGAKKQSVYGVLKYLPDESISLELDGDLEPSSFPFDEVFSPEIILGETNQEEKITCFRTFKTNSSFTSKISKSSSSSFHVHQVFIGDHLKTASKKQFDALHIEPSYLREWINQKPYRTTGNLSNTRHKLVIDKKTPTKELKVKLKGCGTIIRSSYVLQEKYNLDDYSITYDRLIQIIPATHRSLHDLLDIQSKFQRLLTLFIGKPVFPIRIGLFASEKKQYVYHSLLNPKIKKSFHFFDVYIPLSQIKNISSVINSWFAEYEHIKPVLDLLLGTDYAPADYSNFNFLAIIQALETFHSRYFCTTYFSPKQYPDIAKQMIDNIPKKKPRGISAEKFTAFKQRMVSAITYGNESSLRTKLKDLFNTLDDDITSLLTDDVNAFANIIVNTRNYFTHFPKELEDKALQGQDIYFGYRKLKVLLTIYIFKVLGIKDDVIQKTYLAKNEIKWVLSKNL